MTDLTAKAIDRFGDAVAFGILGALGAVAVGIKVWDALAAKRGKPVPDPIILDTQRNGGIVPTRSR